MANVKKINFNKSVDILTENLKEYPLSNYDLKQIIPDIKITTSLDLKNVRFADELVNSQGIGILLWQYKELEGQLGLQEKRDFRLKKFFFFENFKKQGLHFCEYIYPLYI